MAIISIFSGSFCRGEEIAEKTAQIFDYKRIDDILITETSTAFGIPAKKLEQTLQGEVSALNKFTREREKNIAFLKRVLAKLVADGNLVLHGPAVHLLPRNISHILRVCVIADFAYRVEQAVASLSITKGKAEGLIRGYDTKMRQWTGRIADAGPYDSKLYDIVIPIHDTPVEQAMELIKKYAESDQLKTTPRSKMAADDFLLSTGVNLRLTKAGYDLEVFSEQGNVTLLIDHEVIRMKQHQEKLIQIAREVQGVADVQVRPGPRFQSSSTNPWANIDLPPRILLVDDEKEFVQTLSERLQTRNL
ncbi:MAG: cytidylate kinase family protein, partial [Candidatus Zixiibacteriota bacterium]